LILQDGSVEESICFRVVSLLLLFGSHRITIIALTLMAHLALTFFDSFVVFQIPPFLFFLDVFCCFFVVNGLEINRSLLVLPYFGDFALLQRFIVRLFLFDSHLIECFVRLEIDDHSCLFSVARFVVAFALNASLTRVIAIIFEGQFALKALLNESMIFFSDQLILAFELNPFSVVMFGFENSLDFLLFHLRFQNATAEFSLEFRLSIAFIVQLALLQAIPLQYIVHFLFLLSI
jgi:hypothetical protein